MTIFDSQAILDTLFTHSPEKCYLIAYSGGLDSHVLLHLLSQARNSDNRIGLRSIYIDHGLQAESRQWGKHCESLSNQLHIDHLNIALNLKPQSGESIEAVARDARYQAFAENILPNETLLTAQHQDDQAETLLLQLIRGAGLDGLSAMPYKKVSLDYPHIRPLLNLTRAQLEQYADHYQLDFINDPSNEDTRYDRNFLRHHILPTLQERWPALSSNLMRSSTHLAENRTLLEEYLQQDLPNFQGSQPNTLSIHTLQTTPIHKQKAIIRFWIKQQGFLAPSSKKLSHLLADVIHAKEDATPLLAWEGAHVRRYQDDLYIMPPVVDPPKESSYPWDIRGPFTLPCLGIRLNPSLLGDLKEILLKENLPVTVRFRQGGERIKPRNHSHSQSVKKLLQATHIPPWKRSYIPIIYAGNKLIQVIGIASIDKRDLLDEHT